MPPAQLLTSLPPDVRGHLADDLLITVSTTLRIDRHDTAPDVTFYVAGIAWEYTLGYAPEDDDAVTAWAATHGVTPDELGQIDVPVGQIRFATISRHADNGDDQLDSISGDYDTLGAALFGQDADGRSFATSVQGFGGLALLFDDVHIAEPFRGHKISIAVVDRLLSHFEEACGCALLNPVDRAASDEAAVAQSSARLSQHWATLGFKEVRYGVLGIDLGLVRPFHPGRGLRSV